jgi:hypothetical protein
LEDKTEENRTDKQEVPEAPPPKLKAMDKIWVALAIAVFAFLFIIIVVFNVI